jgi:hypothetical protein
VVSVGFVDFEVDSVKSLCQGATKPKTTKVPLSTRRRVDRRLGSDRAAITWSLPPSTR